MCISQLLPVTCVDVVLVNIWHQTLRPGIQTTCTGSARYGSELAYAPHFINLAGPRKVMYTSNGTNTMDFQLWATDVVGRIVSAGKPS